MPLIFIFREKKSIHRTLNKIFFSLVIRSDWLTRWPCQAQGEDEQMLCLFPVVMMMMMIYFSREKRRTDMKQKERIVDARIKRKRENPNKLWWEEKKTNSFNVIARQEHHRLAYYRIRLIGKRMITTAVDYHLSPERKRKITYRTYMYVERKRESLMDETQHVR